VALKRESKKLQKEQLMEVRKRLDSQNLAWKSFVSKILDTYFTRIYLIKAFVIALSLSAFIYCDTFELTHFGLNSLFALLGFYLILGENRIVWFWSGFFIGLLWFYWISFSFVYYDLTYLVPLIILGIAFVYGLWFWLIGRFATTIYLQACLLFSISFIEPFGFNWLKLELVLLNSYFSSTHLQFASFLAAIVCFKGLKSYYKLFSIPFLFLSWMDFSIPAQIAPPNINVEIPTMHIEQSKRWDKAYQSEAIELNFSLIENAIEKGKELIIFPESAFPLYLNMEEMLLDRLKNYSHSISIVTGALTYENENAYNSSYLFEDGQMHIAHKVVLVPFGEEVPFPEFITTWVNRLFFDGAKDYLKAKEPKDFTIKEHLFRNAICFEATKDLLYQNTPRLMIAISNNAWFTPSIEQTLQHLLLRWYAKKYNTIIYHSANAGKSGVIYP